MNVAQLINALQQCKDKNKQVIFLDVDTAGDIHPNSGKFASVTETNQVLLINHSFETLNYTKTPNGLQGPNKNGIIWTE